jgi:hypothetical protein
LCDIDCGHGFWPPLPPQGMARASSGKACWRAVVARSLEPTLYGCPARRRDVVGQLIAHRDQPSGYLERRGAGHEQLVERQRDIFLPDRQHQP